MVDRSISVRQGPPRPPGPGRRGQYLSLTGSRPGSAAGPGRDPADRADAAPPAAARPPPARAARRPAALVYTAWMPSHVVPAAWMGHSHRM